MLLKYSFNSNRFYLYKTANWSGITNKKTTEAKQIWRERFKIFFSHPRCAGQHSQLISSLPTQNAHAGRKPSLFRRSILIYLNQEWAMKKNYDNKNILKYKYEIKANTFLLYNQPLYWSWTCLWMNGNRFSSYESTANWFAQNARTTTVAIAAVPQVKNQKSSSKN